MEELENTSGIDIDADIMSLNEFFKACKHGALIDYDGFGYFCTNTEQTELKVWPSQMNDLTVKFAIELKLTQVAWYNR